MTTQRETVAIPSNCAFVDETFAASIFEWSMDRLYHMQSFNSFPIPIRCGELLVIRTDQIAIWARNRRYGVKRYAIKPIRSNDP